MLGCEHQYDEPCCHKGNLEPKLLWTPTVDEVVFGTIHFIEPW
jgi:hypothetical protein